MATLVTGEALHAAVAGETFIRGGDAKAVDNVKYDLRLGEQALKASIGLPKAIEQMQDAERWIEPGEVVFILTQEELHLPNNMIAMLSPKRAITHRGITVLGGFAIDPGYAGRLWFGLHNFSSSRYALRSGTKIIACLFYELDEEEASHYECVMEEPVTEFPDDLLELIKNYKPIELKSIQEEIASTKAEIATLRLAFSDDKTWKDSFQKGLDEHNRQLGVLIDGLREEKDARKEEDKRISDKLDEKSSLFLGVRWGTIATVSVIGVLITAAVTAVITIWVTNAMQPSAPPAPVAAAPAYAPAPAASPPVATPAP